MIEGVVYDTSDGRIIQRVMVPTRESLRLQVRPGREVIEYRNAERVLPDRQYVDLSGAEPAVVDRAAINPSVSTSTGKATLSNLPDPCEIRWDRQSAEATGGSATISFDEPGTYTLTLRAEPQYLEHTLEVEIP